MSPATARATRPHPARGTRAPRARRVTLEQTGYARLDAPWRAALVVLCERLGDHARAWSHVTPGVRADLAPVFTDPDEPMRVRVLAACAQSFLDPATLLPFAQLAALPDADLRAVLDATAIVRGRVLPVD